MSWQFCFLIALFLVFFEKKIIRGTWWLCLIRTGGLLLQSKKWILLLLKGLNKQGWINWPLSWFKWGHTIFRSKMDNLAWIRTFSEKVAVYFWSTYCTTLTFFQFNTKIFFNRRTKLFSKTSSYKTNWKKDKDKILFKKWRPLFLLNVDSELISKSLVNRLHDVMPNLVRENQRA